MVCNAGLRLLRHASKTRRPNHAANDGRQLHGHVLRRARRAAALSAPARGHLIIVSSIVGQRGVAQMGAIQRDEGGAGRVRRVPARRVRRHRHPRQRGLPGVDRDRIPTRWSATTATRCRGLGPRQTRRRGRPGDRRAASNGRAPEVYPHATSRALADAQRDRAGLHRQARAPVRPATHATGASLARGRIRESDDSDPSDRHGSETRWPLPDPDRAARARARAAARSIVGGWVRDGCWAGRRRTSTSRCSACRADRLRALLDGVRPRRSRRRELHGLQGRRASTCRCPRRESKTGRGHKASPSPAIPTCRSKRPRGGAISPSTRSPGIR